MAFSDHNQPIIFIQDTNEGTISTTNDILDQLKLICYSPHLKNIDLDRFMQMTNDKDFNQYGIRREKDCRQLSLCAQSIRKISFVSHHPCIPIAQETTSVLNDGVHLSIVTAPLDDDSDSISSSSSDYCSSPRNTEEEHEWSSATVERSPSQPNNNDYFDHGLPLFYPVNSCDSILHQSSSRRHSYTEGTVNSGKERLPKSAYTVQKMGKAEAKLEYENSAGNKPLFSVWEEVYIELTDSMLKVYQIISMYRTPLADGDRNVSNGDEPSFKYSPLLYDISLANLKLEIAMDYITEKKEHCVFRMRALDGLQILIKVQPNSPLNAWIENLSLGSTITNDVESQSILNTIELEPFKGWNSFKRSFYQEYVNQDRT